jgi:hypothetical protein
VLLDRSEIVLREPKRGKVKLNGHVDLQIGPITLPSHCRLLLEEALKRIHTEIGGVKPKYPPASVLRLGEAVQKQTFIADGKFDGVRTWNVLLPLRDRILKAFDSGGSAATRRSA